MKSKKYFFTPFISLILLLSSLISLQEYIQITTKKVIKQKLLFSFLVYNRNYIQSMMGLANSASSRNTNPFLSPHLLFLSLFFHLLLNIY